MSGGVLGGSLAVLCITVAAQVGLIRPWLARRGLRITLAGIEDRLAHELASGLLHPHAEVRIRARLEPLIRDPRTAPDAHLHLCRDLAELGPPTYDSLRFQGQALLQAIDDACRRYLRELPRARPAAAAEPRRSTGRAPRHPRQITLPDDEVLVPD